MYYVIKSVKLVSDGRVSCAVTYYNNIEDAKKKYHLDLSQDIGNNNYSYAMEAIINSDGNTIMSEIWNAPRPNPEEV